MQKKETPNAQELRDQPVPPVKGAVTDRRDAVLRPEGVMARELQQRLEDSAVFGSWL